MKPPSTLWNQRRRELSRGGVIPHPHRIRGRMNWLTCLQIVDKVSYREPTHSDCNCEQRMFECRHASGSGFINDWEVVVVVVIVS